MAYLWDRFRDLGCSIDLELAAERSHAEGSHCYTHIVVDFDVLHIVLEVAGPSRLLGGTRNRVAL